MEELRIYHNPKCSTSRKALDLLRDRDVELDVVEYLKQPLSREDLLALIAELEDDPADLVRKDPYFKELGLDPAAYESPEAVADLLVQHPRLMQRPVVVAAGRALIARPVERALDLL